MAGSINKVILIGHLGKDPDIRTANSGDRIANLTVATSDQWRDKTTGERKEKTEWHRVVIFNDNLAKIAEQYLRKGSAIYLEGSLATRKWTDQQGIERYTTEVVLQRFNGNLTLLSKSGGGGPPPADDPDAYGRTTSRDGYDPYMQTPNQDARGNPIPFDDQIPF